jgi:hypothetical protein
MRSSLILLRELISVCAILFSAATDVLLVALFIRRPAACPQL